MERRRHFIFNASDPMEEPSSSSGTSEMVEDNTDETSSSSPRSHKQVLESLGGLGSGSNFSSAELSEEWICKNYDLLYLNHSKGLSSMSNESTFSPGIRTLVGNVTGSLEQEHSALCNRSFDGLLCWPDTPEGTSAVLPCFPELHGIYYNVSRMVTRDCEPGGVWEKVTNYSSCVPLPGQHPQDIESHNLGVTSHVYFFGYCLSLVALVVAMIIFLAFKRQMPWSTSKARKLFQVSDAAEQTLPLEELLNGKHSKMFQEERKSFNQSDLEQVLPVATLATILMGKMMSSSMPDLTTLEVVAHEEL